MSPLNILAQSAQTEYTLAYALTIGLVVLGLLAVSIPRPRRAVDYDPAKAKKAKKKKKSKRKKKKKK